MQLQVSSVRSLSFVGPENEETNLRQAKKYILVINAVWAFDRYVIRADTSCFSLQKSCIFFIAQKQLICSLIASVLFVSPFVDYNSEFVPG